MRELLILLVVVAAAAFIWYVRRQRPAGPAQGESSGRQPPTAEAKLTKDATVASPAIPPETGPPAIVPGAEDKSAGLFQSAAASAVGTTYVQAADHIEEMTAELSKARQDAERAAEQMEMRASEALEAIQAAAAVDGGAVPGDGSDRCPQRYPVKGDLTTMRYRRPGDPTYEQTIPEVCFQSVAAAEGAGFTEGGGESQP